MGNSSSTQKSTAQREAEWKIFKKEQQQELKKRKEALERDEEKHKLTVQRDAEWNSLKEEQQREFKKREEALKENEEKIKLVLSVRKQIEMRRDCVKEYKPGESMEYSDMTFPDILNVGLFGTTGIGKTSLLNSLKYALNGELRDLHREQVAPVDFQGGHTIRRQAVRLTKHIAFIDNRGVGDEDLGAPGQTEEMITQLEGRSSFVQPIVWRDASAVKKLNITKQRHRERIYCAVLVFDARKAKSYFEVAQKFAKCLFEWQGRYPIAVVTNVDRATNEDLDNMNLVLGSTGINDIYKVANISPDKEHLEDEYQLSLLKMIEKCVGDGDRIYELRTQIEEEEITRNGAHN